MSSKKWAEKDKIPMENKKDDPEEESPVGGLCNICHRHSRDLTPTLQWPPSRHRITFEPQDSYGLRTAWCRDCLADEALMKKRVVCIMCHGDPSLKSLGSNTYWSLEFAKALPGGRKPKGYEIIFHGLHSCSWTGHQNKPFFNANLCNECAGKNDHPFFDSNAFDKGTYRFTYLFRVEMKFGVF